MRFGIHLPQSGGAASADAIRACAQQAEQLGFADVWVSDHLVVPQDVNVRADIRHKDSIAHDTFLWLI